MSLFEELKRRNVFRVGIAYAVVSWLLLQVIATVVPILDLPEWVAKLTLVVLVLGFVPALIFAWAFEMTPEGVKKEKDVDVSYLDLKEVCFECPDMEQHRGIIKMVLFHVKEEKEIYKYTIAASKEKVLRSDVLQYETLIGMKVE